MKRILALLLALSMIFALCACGTKDDSTFMKNLQKGLESRAKLEGSMQSGHPQDVHTKYVEAELNAIGDLSAYTFADADLSALAQDYVATLLLQKEAVSFYSTDYMKFNEEYRSKGMYTRAVILCRLVESYGLSVSEKYGSYLNTLLDAGRYYSAFQNLVPDGLVLECVGAPRYETYITNDSPYNFTNVQLHFNTYGENKSYISTGTAFIQNLPAGEKVRVEAYIQEEFTSVELFLTMYDSSSELKTDCHAMEYVNNMFVNIELLTELPAELSYRSSRRIYSTGIVESFSYKVTGWYEGLASVEMAFSGTKTYDRDKEDGVRACYFKWKLYAEDGVVVDSGSVSSGELKVGESYRGATTYASKLPVGNYRLELYNDT